MAAALGRPFMPHQQLIADIAGEVDASGFLCYQEVIVTIPRQSGKTTLLLSVVVGRALAPAAFGRRQRMLYAAQTREDARDKWKDDFLEDLKDAPALKGRFSYRIANGSERMTFHDSNSTFGPIATKITSGHGKILDLGALDEAFAQKDDAVENAWVPAMSTRPMAQLWIPSTAGDSTSVYFKGKVDGGRLAAEEDSGSGTAYVEYSAAADADVESPAVWWGCMPALGFTVRESFIRNELKRAKRKPGGLSGFKRAYCNIWVDRVTDQVIPVEAWALARRPEGVARATDPVIAIDVASDRSHACIAIGYAADDGTPVVRVAAYDAGTDWVSDRVLALRDELNPRAVIIDGAGPALSIREELLAEYVTVTTMGANDMVAACGLLFDGITNAAGPRVLHWGEAPLEAAVAGAEKRDLGDAWAWTRKASLRGSDADICPLVAVTSAYWGQIKFGEDPTLTGSEFG